MPYSNSEETANPGAGTLYVYGTGSGGSGSGKVRRGFSPSPSPAGRGSRQSSRSGLGRKGKSSREASPMPGSFARWDELVKLHEDPVTVATTDSLLRHGIAEYTYIPQAFGGVLGRGKFSTVYKVLGADGAYYALKHTPLYPHHPLISARLLREPTLLAELPSHPCLIGVEGWVRTEGHFYLIEQYAASHIPLSSISNPMQPSRAAYILDQLVSVIRDTLHEKGRVCHRDLKGENVLVDVDTGEILILDLGLATRFSASEPKLTTCCGSPAFHSPEIVLALARPPGEVTYYGPELDIWCIALTLLSLLLQVRFPLGPKHTSTHVMRERVLDRLQELDELYPPHAPWRPPRRSYQDDDTTDYDFEKKEWTRVRRALRDFLEIDGKRRMEKFRSYVIGEKVRRRVDDWEADQDEKKFKSVSFIPAETKYTLPIYLDDDEEADIHKDDGGGHDRHAKGKKKSDRRDRLVMFNPANESERRVKSYIKYLLRSAGILYHLLPTVNDPSVPGTPTTTNPTPTSLTKAEETIFQLVVPVSAENATASQSPSDPQTGWFPSLFSFGRKPPLPSSEAAPSQTRSVSLPPSKRGPKPDHAASPIGATATVSKEKTPSKMLRCYIRLEFVHPPPGQHSPTSTSNAVVDWRRRGSVETFTSVRGGWEGGSTALRHVVSNGSGVYSTRGQGPSNDTGLGGAGTGTSSIKSKNYTFPPAPTRSASVSRPNTTRPPNRRSVSHTPSVHVSRPQPNRIATIDQTGNLHGISQGTSSGNGTHTHNTGGAGTANLALNHTLTMSPLCRQVSLPPSPTHPDHDGGPSSATSRPASRASSRSRNASASAAGLITTSPQHTFSPIQHTWSHQSGHLLRLDAGGQVIIHLSDPRSYSAIKKALSVKPSSPVVYGNNNGHPNGGGGASNDYRRGSTDLSLLSPLTVRRPSLAPSLTMSASAYGHGRHNNGARTSDSEQEQESEQERGDRHRHNNQSSSSGDDEGKNGFNGKSRGLGIVNGNQQLHKTQHAMQEAEEEEEEERGRPRSKEDTSSMLLHLQKVKSRNSAKSSKSSKSSKLFLHRTSESNEDEHDREGVPGKSEAELEPEPGRGSKGVANVQLGGDGDGDGGIELKAELKQPILTPTPAPAPAVHEVRVAGQETKEKKKTKDRSRSSSRSGSKSRSRDRGKSRGLFDVLFGHGHSHSNNSHSQSHNHNHNHKAGHDDDSVQSARTNGHAINELAPAPAPATAAAVSVKPKPRKAIVREPSYRGYGVNGSGSGSGSGSAGSSGYGRAARARSVPPYMNVNELVHHHHF
ncbi:CAMK/CAMKL protein kinase [Kwoniella heveanensis CBS 569]|nr:CAMK/CAMKL protein kinase [Kwoniella heveanensis CBS 569]